MGGGFILYQKKNPQFTDPPSAKSSSLSVSIERPNIKLWKQTLSTNGNVTAWQEAKIGSEINNLRVTHVLVDVGDRVQKGQLLLRLNDAILGADGQQIQAQIQESQSALELAQENYSRSERLEQQGFISSQQLLRDKSQLEQAKARLKAVKASYTSSITRDHKQPFTHQTLALFRHVPLLLAIWHHPQKCYVSF